MSSERLSTSFDSPINSTRSSFKNHAFEMTDDIDEELKSNKSNKTNSTKSIQEDVTHEKEPMEQNDVQVTVDEHSNQKDMDKNTMFFRDDKRRIDFIITYEDLQESDSLMQIKLDQREKFEYNLKLAGLELELEPCCNSVNNKTNYLKVHATWRALLQGAEFIKLQKPLKYSRMDDVMDEIDTVSCFAFMEVGEEITGADPDYFSFPISEENIKLFEIPAVKDDFFTNSERSLIVAEFLSRAEYPENSKHETGKIKFGIESLIKKRVYSSAFPLHEGPENSLSRNKKLDFYDGPDCDRKRLKESWARWGRIFNFQPMNVVRRYFGEKIAIYFTWLGFYTAMLIPASILGIAAFLYGVLTLNNATASKEMCDAKIGGEVIMCPKCDLRCPFTTLDKSCLYSKITHVFDNYATVAFALVMSLWATMFLEFWKRKQAEIQYEWDVQEYEEEEKLRPEFEMNVKHNRINPITLKPEPYLPIWSKIPRKCVSFGVIFFMMILVLAAILGVIIYRLIIIGVFYAIQQAEIQKFASIITSITAAVINLIVIQLLNFIYGKLAMYLTILEAPSTHTKFEDSYTTKMFLFQFVNYYGSIFYIAFFKGAFIEYPTSDANYVFGGAGSNKYMQEQCDPSGCLVDLFIQLAIVMTGKQVLNNAKELGVPYLKKLYKKCSSEKGESEENLYMRWEQDNDLPESASLFDEYLEMVIQFGFITIFVAAFPLAPFFALINNIFEIRLDAIKSLNVMKRPVANKAQDIGAWFGILKSITFLAVLSNAFIISFTSDFVPRLVYEYTEVGGGNGQLDGYVKHKLSLFNTSDYLSGSEMGPDEKNWRINEGEILAVGNRSLLETCYYTGYFKYNSHISLNGTRLAPLAPGEIDGDRYEKTRFYWRVMLARIAMVLIFEHAVFLLTYLIQIIVPDVSGRVQQLKVYENQLIRHVLFQKIQQKNSGTEYRNNDDTNTDGTLKKRKTNYESIP